MRVLLGLNDHWALIPYERFGVLQEIETYISNSWNAIQDDTT